jgi:hypothetical protein
MNKKKIKAYIQQRIDYWETACEDHEKDYEHLTHIKDVWERGQEIGEERGILDGLYQVMEFLDGQRR